MKFVYLMVLFAAVLVSACADPAANKPKATTSEPSKPAANASPTDLTSTGSALTISSENSKIGFTGSKVTGKHDGGFKDFKGMIDLGDKPETSKVAVEIQMASVYTDADGLTKHLQTGDFFEVEKFPTASFASTVIGPGGSAGNYSVTGDLTLRGVRKSITFPATINVTPEEVTVKAEFSINRKDFGIVYAGKADDLIRDDVVIKLDLKSPRKK